MKKKVITFVLAAFCTICICGGKITVAQEGTAAEVTYEPQEPGTAATSVPIPTQIPDVEPTQPPAVEPTPERTPGPESVPTETPASRVSSLKKVSGVSIVRYSTNTVKIKWRKHKKAKYYRVYYSKEKRGSYHLAGITKNQQILVNHLKNKNTYYFYVQACIYKKESGYDSKASKKVRMTMKPYQRKIIFAGDSICEGIGYGQAFPQMHSGAKKKTVAYRGLNTVTFHTKRIFGGQTGLQKLISEQPYRAYMMLGMNEVHYRPADQMIAEYRDLIKAIRQASPYTDIVLCAVSPVTKEEYMRLPGMGQIPSFNRKLKKLARQLRLTYFDYTDFLKDADGYLKSQYAAADGYHWQPAAYVEFGDIVGKFDKSLDR